MAVNDDGFSGSGRSSPPAPLSGHRAMRITLNFGFVCAVLCIMLGAFKFGQNHGVVFTLGCVLLTFWIIMTPSARRSGKL